MFMGLTGMHLLIILGIVVLLFGSTKLPALSKGLGQSLKIFRNEVRDDPERKSEPAGGGVESDAASHAPETSRRDDSRGSR